MNNDEERKSIKLPNEPTRFSTGDLDNLLIHCTKANASDITLQTGEHVYAEVYGRLYKVTSRKLSHNETSDILNGIYGANGTAQIMSGQDIDTHYEIRPSRTERYRFRINATGCQVEGHTGIQITARTIPTEPPTLASMNLPQVLIDAIAPEQGVVYVTGATGSGKSTLLASIIRELAIQKDSNRKILTYESPIEFVYDRVDKTSAIVSQSEIPRHLPSFVAGVRNALRRKPHAILVGEARDQVTISAVMEAAMTGHPVYTTLHSNGVSETIRRLVTSFPQAERSARTVDIFETVRVIIWQMLVPTEDGKRTPLREFLIFNEDIRDELLETDLDQVTSTTRRLLAKHGQTMLADAKDKHAQGLLNDRQFHLIEKSYLRTNTNE